MALINVIFKIMSKSYATNIGLITNRIISPNQIVSIKGRFVLHEVLALQEIIHEMKSEKLEVSC
jgi:hypothetical protein